MQTPTRQTYTELQTVFDTFNRELFGGELPACLLTLQREKRTYGYFSAQRFGSVDGQKTDEIALNPAYFAALPLIEILQTICHEMTHVWQYHFGEPGRGRYHNAEWADKMESIGLMPSSTGRPGGIRTGDRMADYPKEGGRFLDVCGQLLHSDFRISWYDRYPASDAIAAGQQSYGLNMDLPASAVTIAAEAGVPMGRPLAAQGARPTASGTLPPEISTPGKGNRSKYSCSCGFNVWGKPGLRIVCADCESPFTEDV